MRSVWICSRNDAINNLLIIIAGIVVMFAKTPWPDVIVAIFIVVIALQSSISLLRQAWAEYDRCRCVDCE